MSVKEKFRRQWTAKFPDDDPPALPCLDGSDAIDVAAVESSLQKTNELIANLSAQLRKQEFVAAFLWDTVHFLKEIQELGPPRPPKLNISTGGGGGGIGGTYGGLDELIPVQDVASVSFSAGAGQNGLFRSISATFEGGYDVVMDYSNDCQLVKQLSSDSATSTGSTRSAQDSFRKKSEPLLDWEDENRRESVHEGGRTRSLDSRLLYSEELKAVIEKQAIALLQSARLNRPEMPLPTQGGLQAVAMSGKKSKPVPAPRNSGAKLFGRADLSPASSCMSSSASPSPTTDDSVSMLKETGQKKMWSSQGELKAAVGFANRHSFGGTKNLQGPPFASSRSMIESPESPMSVVNILDGSVGSRSSINQPPDVVPSEHRNSRKVSSLYDPTDYEEAVPVRRAFVESNDASSDEDEPLYYNLMLLKQQTLDRVQTLFSKAGSDGGPGAPVAKFRARGYQQLGIVKESDPTTVSPTRDSGEFL